MAVSARGGAISGRVADINMSAQNNARRKRKHRQRIWRNAPREQKRKKQATQYIDYIKYRA